MCRTKKDLAEAETLTGWNLDAVSHSCLTSPDLSGWVELDSLYFDVMHQYWSCGTIAAELGLWYTALEKAGVRLQQIRSWVSLGWKTTSAGRSNPLRFFDDKLWRLNGDYRGDAATCAAALPLCFGFGEEMLRGNFTGLQNELNSLRSLYSVVLWIQWTKQDVSHVSNLQPLQKEHMANFAHAYSRSAVRPKMHMPYIRKRSVESGPASLIRLCAKESTERTRVNVEPRLKNWVFSPKESCCTLRQTMFARLHQLNVSLGNFWAKQEKILRRPRPFRSLQIVSLQKAWNTNAFRICKGSFCRLQAHGLWKYTQACFSRKTKHFGFLLNLCFLRRKMQTACTNGNAQHVDDAGFCQQVNFATGNCHNLFVRQNTLFASCFEKSQSNKLPLHGKTPKRNCKLLHNSIKNLPNSKKRRTHVTFKKATKKVRLKLGRT